MSADKARPPAAGAAFSKEERFESRAIERTRQYDVRRLFFLRTTRELVDECFRVRRPSRLKSGAANTSFQDDEALRSDETMGDPSVSWFQEIRGNSMTS
mmetsp:Transcript_67845/g.196279  ORF Transcript_67845/g.196279 Transcript_67845/m.196279 type:complete len:99 (-) Transcript_67845:286-582(-)